jgi:hypothetical protein
MRAALPIALGVAALAFVASRTERGRVAAADVVGGIVNALTPRGIRNNNPGNIEWIADERRRWRGMVRADGRYGVFDTAANGVRAIGGEIRANFRRGENTLQQILTEWAPPTENDTESYIRHAERELGVDRRAPLRASQIPALAAVIIEHENGVQPYKFDDVVAWVNS